MSGATPSFPHVLSWHTGGQLCVYFNNAHRVRSGRKVLLGHVGGGLTYGARLPSQSRGSLRSDPYHGHSAPPAYERQRIGSTRLRRYEFCKYPSLAIHLI